MNAEKIAEYESKLRQLLKELEAQMSQTNDERAPVAVDGRMGRVSRGDALQTQQLAVEMGRRREQQLSRVRVALERIQRGNYGVCGRCAQPIAEARLDAMPDVVFCVRCAAGTSPS